MDNGGLWQYKRVEIEEHAMTYAVLIPAKTINGTQIVPTLVTDDIEEAKTCAREYRAYLTRKGYDSWAKHIKIQSPKTAEGYMELAAKVSAYGHELDDWSNGNSFQGQNLISWGNILRRRADELHNPED